MIINLKFYLFLLPLSIWAIVGKHIVKYMKKYQNGVREYLDQHKNKAKTPSMGGIFIICIYLISLYIITSLNKQNFLVTFCLIIFGIIGFWDDYYKLRYKKGISSFQKFTAQIAASALVSLLYIKIFNNYTISMPFGMEVNNIYIYIFWFMLVLVATSNAVNITDGLDGLATINIIPAISFFSYLTYSINPYLTNISNAGFALIGSCIGFLIYNYFPAKIFMGDVGSLALGSTLGLLALISKHEILLIPIGIFFVVETTSTIIQVLYYKKTKNRFFKMAPFHHHLELTGFKEKNITILSGILTTIISIILLITVTN